MANNFEAKLAEASSAEKLKAAKQLLKNSAVACVWRNPDGKINAAFQDHSRYAYTAVTPGTPGSASCSCGDTCGKLCEHAVAAIMYSGRFKQEFKPIDDGVSNYAGLKFENLESLAAHDGHKATAQVFIQVLSAFPHAPSRWENSVLSVKLRNKGREYLGNVNNLRQLFFEKNLGIAMKLSDFSLQDQQIIRFLAINGTPDSSSVLLDSEQTAEFFHCLIGYDRFFRDGRQLFIHGEATQPVILRFKSGGEPRLSPGIKTGGALLPIKQAKVISGRAGCWIGRQGEYFFIPATLDVSWLRNFFRTGEQSFPGKISENLLQNGKFPLPVMDMEHPEPDTPELKILLSGSSGQDKELILKVYALYGSSMCKLNSGRLLKNGDSFFLRDECQELKLVSELEMFGFSRRQDNFILTNTEAIGIFLDQVLAQWLKQRNNICLDAGLAELCYGGKGLQDVTFRSQIIRSGTEYHTIHYDFMLENMPVPLKKMTSAGRAGQKYINTDDGIICGRISEAMRFFLRGAEKIMHNLNEKERTFELPFYAVPYFMHLTARLPGACPPELLSPAEIHPAAAAPPEHEFLAELRPYQTDGAAWLQKMTDAGFNVILADEMGLGKTVQILALLASRKTAGMAPALVICPASLVINWEREVHKFVPDFRAAAMTGSGRENIWDNSGRYDIIIISYATARKDAEQLHKNRFSYLILDEAQHIKNPGTANALNCKQISAEHRIVLTGTPLENSSEDLWSIFDFLHPGMLGSFNAFKHAYGTIADDKELQLDLAARVAPFLKRRTKADVGQELPPKQERTLFCEMGVEQRKLYETIRASGFRQLSRLAQGDAKANAEIFTALLRLRQVCCHPELLPENQGANIPSAKFELLQELVLEHIDSGHKLLLFSQFTSLLGKISAWLDQSEIPYEYLDGGTRHRQTHVDNFNNDPAIPLFLLSLKAGGTGLNLTGADTVIICDPWWNPAAELQAADRTHRIGQTRPVSSLKLLVKDSIEEKILSLQTRKQEIFDSVIDNPAAAGSKLSLDELRFLLS